MSDQHEYVFMSNKMCRKLEKRGTLTEARFERPRYLYLNGKRVIALPRRVDVIPDGEILTEAPGEARPVLREWFRSNNWPIPECLCGDE